jgi:hypothetical protein
MEAIDGEPVAASLHVGIKFCVQGVPCTQLNPAEPNGHPMHPAVVGAPSVRILTPMAAN